jgi:lysophospholipase L1-like esterase
MTGLSPAGFAALSAAPCNIGVKTEKGGGMLKKLFVPWSAFSILALVTVTAPAAAASPPGRANTPVYYLSLGTSLAAGVQADPDSCESVVTDVSYPGLIAENIRADQNIRKLRHVNLGCPGENSDTFITGGLCKFPHGSQLEEALNFLHAHGKFTGLITIDLGANDALPCFFAPPEGGLVPCFLDAVANLADNLGVILDALQQAAPGVPIVGMNYYNPLLVVDPATAPLQNALNAALQVIYGINEIPVANVAGAFSTGTPQGDQGLICEWTWMCENNCGNIHPNVFGYEAIAEAFMDELPDIQISEPPRRR